MRARRPLVVLAAVVAVALVLVTGCRPREAPTGLLARAADLHGAHYVVAGGLTDELTILCQMTAAAVEAAGAEAVEQCGKVGVVDVRGPRDASAVDTGWASVSDVDRDRDGRPDPPRPFADLARDDAARGVTWMAPTAFSDVDAVVVRPGGVRTLSELAASPTPVTLCATPDAVTDPRRLAGVLAVYGFGPRVTVRGVDAGAVLTGVVRGECTAGEVPGTSGRIPALGLQALTDDRGAFGPGGLAPIMRSEVFAAHPEVAAVMREVTTRLTGDAMRELDREVGVDGRDPRDVARRWLAAQGLTA